MGGGIASAQAVTEDDPTLGEIIVRLRTWIFLAWPGMALLVAFMACACGGTASVADAESDHGQASNPADLEAVSLSADSRLKVVATTNIVGDVVAQVGGDQIELTTLMGVGVDPHSYVPTPSHTAAIHDAHVVFANGAGLETNLEEMVQAAGGSAVHVSLSDQLDLLALDGEHDPQPSPGGESPQRVAVPDHDHSDVDPHVWFSVPNVKQWVRTIEDTLSAMDPDGAERYSANAEQYTRTLNELDAWVKDRVATIPQANRTLVTSHKTFGYFAERYGLEQLGAVYPVNPSSDPSAQEIAELEDAIRSHGASAIFVESTVNPKLADQVARDTGVALVPLFTGSLGGPGSGVESYADLIRFDTDAIVRALGQVREEP
jgi:manganese/iron transport system substrate-binding protein